MTYKKGNVIQLTADLSEALLELLLHDEGMVDGVEVGPWYLPGEVSWYREKLSSMPFFFHGADLIHEVGLRPGVIGEIQSQVTASGSPWVSLHLSAWAPRWLRALLRRGWPLPQPDPQWDASRLIWQARKVAKAVEMPVLLENNDPLPWPGYTYYTEPAYIRNILEQTGCGLLLDTGHARVAATALGITAQDYLSQMPLECTVEVHISGPRELNGRLYDAHETIQEADTGLLEFVLGKCQPQVVTLEYVREPEALKEQLALLRELLGKETKKKQPRNTQKTRKKKHKRSI